ncbi:WapI family immunity protein [Pelomonas caseinilytica]|uniref:WapI family immunity protein n=1 Tax=Pelomonas caseinilytica TaxID=2906763 RepID=UPI003B025801
MPVIHFGTGSEYVKISLPPSFATEAWLQVDVEIAVCGFQGRIEPWVEPTDIEVFSKQLRALYDSLQGEATFCPRDRQFTIKGRADLWARSRAWIAVRGTVTAPERRLARKMSRRGVLKPLSGPFCPFRTHLGHGLPTTLAWR